MLPICQDNAMQPSRVQGCCPQIIDLAADHKPHCRTLWVYVMFWSLATTCPVPLITHFEVIRPSTPTGPRAWMRLVLMPTCDLQWKYLQDQSFLLQRYWWQKATNIIANLKDTVKFHFLCQK
eukprot:867266-Pelagomonas_calceolata.AAC.1